MPLGLRLLAPAAALLVLAGCGGGGNDSADNTPFGSDFRMAFNASTNDDPLDFEGAGGLEVDLRAEPTDI